MAGIRGIRRDTEVRVREDKVKMSEIKSPH